MLNVRFVMLALAVAPALSSGSTPQPRVHDDFTSQQQLTVRNGSTLRTVPIVAHPDGGKSLRVDLVAEALGGSVVSESPQSFRLQLGEFALSFTAGAAFALAVEDTFPLAASTYRLGNRLFVPLSVVSELLPRVAGGLIFDAARNELRKFTIVTTHQPAQRTTASSPVQRVAVNASNTTRPTVLPSGRRQTVVVDAGHGGVDPGMSAAAGGRRIREKDVTLQVAMELRDALAKRGMTVVMTRTRDTLIALADRPRIANQAKGDLFISVHVNAANPRWPNASAARGFETYFLAEAQTEDEKRVEAMENEAIRFETTADATSDDPLGFIIRDMAQNEHLRESSRLAQLIQHQMSTIHPGPNRGVKQAGFRVLVSAFMPAVLVEIGYGTNASDALWMTNRAKQVDLAESIALAAESYLAEYDRKVGGK